MTDNKLLARGGDDSVQDLKLMDRNLFDAVKNENFEECLFLLSANADPNRLFFMEKEEKNESEAMSAFHLAVGLDDIKFTKLFLMSRAKKNQRRKKVDPNTKSDPSKWTPLHVCSYWDKPDTLELLFSAFSNGLAVNLFNLTKKGESALDMALAQQNLQCVSLLQSHINRMIGKLSINGLVALDKQVGQVGQHKKEKEYIPKDEEVEKDKMKKQKSEKKQIKTLKSISTQTRVNLGSFLTSKMDETKKIKRTGSNDLDDDKKDAISKPETVIVISSSSKDSESSRIHELRCNKETQTIGKLFKLSDVTKALANSKIK